MFPLKSDAKEESRSDLRTSVFGGVMFGVVEEISLCGRKKKWGSIFGRLFTVGERGLEGGQAEDEEQGERERKSEAKCIKEQRIMAEVVRNAHFG